MTESDYADIERRVIDTDPRPVTSVPTMDVDRRQRETVEALERACYGSSTSSPNLLAT